MATTIETQDIMPVRSRVSWGAVFAGATVALAVSLLLGALGAALGLSLTTSISDRSLGIGAAIWAVASLLISLFLGGWVTSQCTVGENRLEAMLYGVIMWGVVFAMLMWLTATGVRYGFTTMINLISSPAASVIMNPSEENLRSMGFTAEQAASWRRQLDEARLRSQNLGAETRAVVDDPRTTAAAWWTFGGILLSMLAAVGGALAGAGPQVWLTALRLRATSVGLRVPAQGTMPR